MITDWSSDQNLVRNLIRAWCFWTIYKHAFACFCIYFFFFLSLVFSYSVIHTVALLLYMPDCHIILSSTTLSLVVIDTLRLASESKWQCVYCCLEIWSLIVSICLWSSINWLIKAAMLAADLIWSDLIWLTD